MSREHMPEGDWHEEVAMEIISYLGILQMPEGRIMEKKE